MRTLRVLVLGLMVALAASVGHRPLQTQAPIRSPLVESYWRQQSTGDFLIFCPLRVAVRALNAPVLDGLVTLEVTVTNTMDAGSYLWWLDLSRGALDTTGVPVAWSGWLDPGEVRRETVLARVKTTEPVLVSAKFMPEEYQRLKRPPAEANLRLYPVEVHGDRVTSSWDPASGRSLRTGHPVISPMRGGGTSIFLGTVTAVEAVEVTR